MPARVYIETTIVSYLTAWPSQDVIRAAHQEITRSWWNDSRDAFHVYVSAATVREASGGDPIAAAERLRALRGLPELEITVEAEELAQELLNEIPLPARAAVDALHIAVAAVHGMDYLLTWNCTHIANATLRSRIESVCRLKGFEPPIICTPEELAEDFDNV